MIDSVASLTLIGIGLSMTLIVYRMLIGPTTLDRVLALDTLSTNFIAFVVVLSVRLGTDLYLEGALVLAVLAFVSTVAISKFLMRGRIIE